MVKYLQMDGVDDFLKSPSISFDEVIIDFVPKPVSGTNEYYFDARTGGTSYIYNRTDGVEILSGLSSAFWNNTLFSNGSQGVGSGSRGTLRLVTSAINTDDVNFFSNSGNSFNLAADVYSVKLLLSGTVQAYYDMSLGNQVVGTVQDQSGNGNHATLTGGTWLDDGTGGGTGTIQDGIATLSSTSLFNSSGIPIRISNGIINGLSSFSSNAVPIRLSNSTILGYGTLTATSSVGSQILANAILNGSSLLDSNGIGLKLGQSNSIGNSTINSTGNYITQSDSSIFGNSLVSVTVGSQSLASAIIQSTTNLTANGIKQLIGTSQVNGLSTTSFNGVRVILSDSGIDVNGDLEANAIKLINLDSNINSHGGLFSDGFKLLTGNSNIDVHSTFNAFVGNKYVQVIPIAIDIKRNELIVTNIHRRESATTHIKRKSAIQVKI